MKIVTHIDQIPRVQKPIALTIGCYDGVHLGHQTLFKELRKYTRKGGTNVIFTFSNHPSTLLTPEKPTSLIMLLEHRLHLLESWGFHLAILLPFDQNLANLPYNVFIRTLYARLPFDYLLLGANAHFGKDRCGDSSAIYHLSKQLHFHAQYIPKETYHKEPISSNRIRSSLAQGDLKRAKKMLARPYSIRIPFVQPIQESSIQYCLNLNFEDISTLPPAVYAVDIGKVPAISFYRTIKNIHDQTRVSMTLYFEQKLPSTSHFILTFISYLHNEIDPDPNETCVETASLQSNPYLAPGLQTLCAIIRKNLQSSLP